MKIEVREGVDFSLGEAIEAEMADLAKTTKTCLNANFMGVLVMLL